MAAAPHEFDFSDPATADAYDELSLWSAMAGLLLFRYLPLSPGAAALDLGCGTGFPAIELAERLGPRAKVSGLDPWRTALERARRKAHTRGVANVTFVDGDGGAMPFADGSFDLIVSNLGVNNFDDPQKALAERRRVLRRGGTIALTTNLQGHMAEFYEVFRGLLDAEGARRLDAHVAHRATIDGLTAMLGAAGLRTCRVERQSVPMRFADGAALLRHSFIRLGFLPAWREVVPDGSREKVFAQLREALDARASDRGGLELTIPLAYVEAVRER